MYLDNIHKTNLCSNLRKKNIFKNIQGVCECNETESNARSRETKRNRDKPSIHVNIQVCRRL